MSNVIPKKNERLSMKELTVRGHVQADQRALNADYEPHWHDYFEIEILTEGEIVHTLNGEDCALTAGSAYLLTPTDFHAVRVKKESRLWNVSFSEEAISEKRFCSLVSSERKTHFKLDAETVKKLTAIAELISAEAARDDGGCSRELLECLLTVLFRSGDSRVSQSSSAEQISGIRKAILYLEMHFREAPTLACVAEHSGFHPHYLSELFKQVTGQTYTERLNALRVGFAKTMLSNGFSVTETCYRSGFGSLSNFLAVFKKHVGASPEKYKMDNRRIP